MNGNDNYCGVWPVMLTPFDENREIDWDSLKKLIDWYIKAGVHGLFANCQSSEMFFLSEAESLQLTRFVLDYVDGRVPVVASGHTACGLSQQIDQLGKIAETGVDSVILISNRLAMPGESDEVALANLQKITAAVTDKVGLGIYECPHPYKRLLSDEIVNWCAQSDRYTFIKDTCCQIATIKRRLALTKGSRLHIANANGQTLLASLQAGAHGYSGVMTNFHPELYVWLYESWPHEPEKAVIVSDYLSTASLAESLDYPICAKDFHVSIGNFKTVASRTREAGNYYSAHFQSTVQQMVRLGEVLKEQLALSAPSW
ncbi:dihydrodipicolinate synthase family protein [Propionivibrio limicola]|uniref:dihydrodipicolinate synthase family protein n=1 Tax=Propionivibrio limicola TaxID=167645 RepID=UPI001290CBB8|nr:dihydrodipicolinate synthase family protein [Propionivibrio limicola]